MATHSGVRSPAWATSSLATGLSNASRLAAAPEPTNGMPQALQHVAQRAVLARGAVQQGHDAVRPMGAKAVEQSRVDVGLEHLPVGTLEPQRLGHPAAGSQRDVALGREAAGQDQHVHRHSY